MLCPLSVSPFSVSPCPTVVQDVLCLEPILQPSYIITLYVLPTTFPEPGLDFHTLAAHSAPQWVCVVQLRADPCFPPLEIHTKPDGIGFAENTVTSCLGKQLFSRRAMAFFGLFGGKVVDFGVVVVDFPAISAIGDGLT